MRTRAFGMVLAVALMFVTSAPAVAQQAKCLAGKTKCAVKKGTGLLKCHTKAETPGKPADPNADGCIDKVVGKFDGGAKPTKGCFEKLENKSDNDCITFDDTASAEAAIDSCVAAFVDAIDPAPITQTKCGAGKKKCVSKLLNGLLKCRAKSQTPGKSTDPNSKGCVDKAITKYTGGSLVTKGCFAKIELKNGNDCQPPTLNSDALQTLVENCDQDLAALLTDTMSTSSTTVVVPTTTTSTTVVVPTTTTSTTAVVPTTTTSTTAVVPTTTSTTAVVPTTTSTTVVVPTTTSTTVVVPTTTSTTAVIPTTTTSTTIPSGGVELKGALTATPGRFNYNLTVGLPGANAACNTNFTGTHACSYAELQIAEAAGDLVGLQDIAANTVTGFWAIDNSAAPLSQCQDDVSSFLNWEYGTAHTPSRGNHVSLNNGTGALGALQTGQQCNFTTKWVGCCV